MLYLTVDGCLSGTGIRDSVEGGYLEPAELGLSARLLERISSWQRSYEDAHYEQFSDKKRNAELDQEGLAICQLMENEIPDAKIQYFSGAEMKGILR